MIIVMSPQATEADITHITDRLTDLGFKIHLSKGVERTLIGAVGDKRAVNWESLTRFAGVLEIVPIKRPFKMVSREVHPDDTIIRVGNIEIGGPQLHVPVMAGPCCVESREQLLMTAEAVKASGATFLRGGAFKPRTSPYSFQGLGEEGLKILAEAREKTGLPIVTEVMDSEDVELVAEYADILQIGARNMQNFTLLKKVGKIRKPIMLKRGMAATIEEWLMSAEYVFSEGNYQVILCERGIRSVETQHTRNTFDLSAIPVVRELCHLPIIADPSHGTGRWKLVPPMSLAAVAAGADGLIVEVHPKPEEALSDGPQSLTFDVFEDMMHDIRKLESALPKAR